MSYLVLARKYRPAAFDSVSGQDHVTRTLSNSILRDKVAHAILLTGPRGVGKTSIARIFSKCLNCIEGPTVTPCLKCVNCREIAAGNSIAVREIDGASHNSVDNVRELIESFRSLPAPGSKYKIYIIDEVHMLSTSAFNALLKSLEEPPPHTVFILATTEVHKIPDTVLSRCQRHDLRALGNSVVEERLQFICSQEGLSPEPGVLRLVARLSEGSMRDAQSILERLQAYASEKVLSLKDAVTVLGAVEKAALFRLSHSILAREVEQALEVIDELIQTGVDVGFLIRDFVTHFREINVAKLGGEKALTQLGFLEDDRVELLRQSALRDPHDILDLATIAREGGDAALRSAFPKYALEALITRMALREAVMDIAKLIEKLDSGGIASGSASQKTPGQVSQHRQSVNQPSPGIVTPKDAKVSSSKSELSWDLFVKYVADSVSKMLSEQLKRMALVRFGDNIAEIRGPEFSVSYLEQKENRTKLESALRNFLATDSAKIVIKTGSGSSAAEPGSILQIEQSKRNQTQKEREGEVLNHPQVQKIQDLFPGSTIEVKVKEGRK